MDTQTDKHRNKLESVMENHKTETKSLQTKHKHEISVIKENHETGVKWLKDKIEGCESEIISLKLHASLHVVIWTYDLDINSSGVQIAGSRRDDSTSRNTNVQNLATYADMAVSSVNNSSSNRNDKPYVLLVGMSNIAKIREDKLTPETAVMRSIAYTIPETLETIKNFQCNQAPKEVVFHSLTNDIKTRSPAECIELFTEVIEETRSRWKDPKVVISLETARSDNTRYNTNVKLLNALLQQKFLGVPNFYLCDNSSFFINGEP